MKKKAIMGQQIENGPAYSRLIKKRIGSFYTPQRLAKLIAVETLETWFIRQGGICKADIAGLGRVNRTVKRRLLKSLQTIRVLDPSVGAGVFLLTAADWLNNMREGLGDDMTPSQRRIHIVNESLYGVDLAKEAVTECKQNLVTWIYQRNVIPDSLVERELTNIRCGNSLIGSVDHSPTTKQSRTDEFHWFDEFSDVMQNSEPGFDVILGNPPYGNLLIEKERQQIESTYPFNVGGGRLGTWNSAAHFIVRSRMLMKKGGQLGFLVPNSILRVHQFNKIRNFLLDEMRLWKIIDEGSPFDGVTLEMVSIFCEAIKENQFAPIEVESRRPEHEQSNQVDWDFLKSSRVFSIYHDTIFQEILKRGKRDLLTASRGRDIPKQHVSQYKSDVFKIPYITSGRSVRRYQINTRQQYYTDDSFIRDKLMQESFENELLVATKNYRYPRCVVKPPGIIHGGGIVKITPLSQNADLRALGLILNSRLIRYICVRYLTNYSQLTTCLNTGIMNDLPLVIPKHTDIFAMLFDAISQLYSNTINLEFNDCRQFLEHLSDALVYELYFCKNQVLQQLLVETLSKENRNQYDARTICNYLQREDVIAAFRDIMSNSTVRRIEAELVADEKKSLRY